MKKKTGPKVTKPNRSSDLFRIEKNTKRRLEYLKVLRKQNEPKTSLSDLVNESLELLLDSEDVPPANSISDSLLGRKGVEL